jgi:hypothetical protein
METQTCAAVPQEDGGLYVYSATQAADFTLRTVSAATGIPAGKIRVEMRRMGGAYGGKITRSIHAAVSTSVAATLLGVPVRTQVCNSVPLVTCLYVVSACCLFVLPVPNLCSTLMIPNHNLTLSFLIVCSLRLI